MNSTWSNDLLLDHPTGPNNSCNKEDFEMSKILNVSPYAHNHNFLAESYSTATLKRIRQAAWT